MLRIFLILALFLSACGNTSGLNMAQYGDENATRQDFIHCHGYGCSNGIRTAFLDAEWKSIRKIFKTKPKNAAAEREKIARAIARMEHITGEVVGTRDDLPKAPIVRQSYKELDCIDETINTTKYLQFLAADGLLKFHDVGKPTYKGLMLNGVYPHNSATIIERETGVAYAVDSYMFKNGEMPDIRRLDNWQQYRYEELERAENLTRAAQERLAP